MHSNTAFCPYILISFTEAILLHNLLLRLSTRHSQLFPLFSKNTSIYLHLLVHYNCTLVILKHLQLVSYRSWGCSKRTTIRKILWIEGICFILVTPSWSYMFSLFFTSSLSFCSCTFTFLSPCRVSSPCNLAKSVTLKSPCTTTTPVAIVLGQSTLARTETRNRTLTLLAKRRLLGTILKTQVRWVIIMLYRIKLACIEAEWLQFLLEGHNFWINRHLR